jgi:hypothetical protein
MPRSRFTARIHLLVAKQAPVAVILRRKPSRTWHILRWNLQTDELTPGSWFRGKLYPMRSDLSWDGRLMSYLAMGGTLDTWNGLCEVPFLKTVAQWENTGTWNGGAVWLKPDTAYLNLFWMSCPLQPPPLSPPKASGSGWLSKIGTWLCGTQEARPEALLSSLVTWKSKEWKSKLTIRTLKTNGGEDFSILFHRLHRDGWRPAAGGRPGPDVFGVDGTWIGPGSFEEAVDNEKGWIWQPTTRHPVLRVRYAGYLLEGRQDQPLRLDPKLLQGRTGYILHFDLPDLPGVLGPQVDWATWTSTGDLVYALHGSVYRHSLQTLQEGKAPVRLDLESLAPPATVIGFRGVSAE